MAGDGARARWQAGVGGCVMGRIGDDSVADFLSVLASRSPTPGGGSASALVGAVAAALCGMVGRLNDKKTGEAGPLHDTIQQADAVLERLSRLADADIEAFNGLMATWKLPDDPANAARKQAATITATESPLEIMGAAVEVMKLAKRGLELSKKNCLSDAGVAGFVAHAALEGARLNVMINLPGITDPAKRDALRGQSDALRAEARALRAEIDKRVDANYA